MNNEQFEELTGRIQGIADFMLGLTAQLEIDGTIDGAGFTERLRERAGTLNITDRRQCTDAARRILEDMAHHLEKMRNIRRSQPYQTDSPINAKTN